VLGFAARHQERVRAATVVVGGAIQEEEDLSGLIEINRRGYYAVRESWEAVYELLAPRRTEILADPLAGFRAMMEAAPASDKAVMDDPAWQRVLVEDVTEALRPGAEGWADEARAVAESWDFDPAEVQCSVTWWHGEQDANAPITAVRRLLAQMPGVDLRIWTEAGHLEAYRRHDEILAELLAR
jgi:pimeloyl-ACP methyl ester carboxylesterase